MSHTRESLEAFIEKSKIDVKNSFSGKIEPAKTIGCPICGKDTDLKKEETTVEVSTFILEGTHWFYECKNCNETYTTTESDTISIASMKIK